MKLEKILSIREAHRRAISIRFDEFEAAKEDSTSLKCRILLRGIEEKVEILTSLNDKVQEAIETADITDEILATEDYTTQLHIRVGEIREYMRLKSVQDGRAQQNTSNNQTEETEVTPAVTRIDTTDGPSYVRDFNIQTVTDNTGLQHQTVSKSTYLNNHKLPTLTLPTFTGDILDWHSFWDAFNAAVHSNPHLTDAQKFTYLKSQLEGDAARAVAGFSLTNANYTEALELLTDRFGRTSKIINAHMQALLHLPPPSSQIDSLRNYYDQLETNIRGLETLGENQENFGGLLVPVILGKLPSELRRNLARINETERWTLRDLRKAFKRELNIIEAGLDDTNHQSAYIPTASFHTGTSTRRHSDTQNLQHKQVPAQHKPKCAFCEGNHLPADCFQVKDHNTRIHVIKQKRLCFNCLHSHKVSDCPSHFRCRTCKRKHHTSICSNNQTVAPGHQHSATRTSHANIVNTCPLTPPFPATQPTSSQPYTFTLHTTSCEPTQGVLLKTAVAPICTDKLQVEANVLFDEGAQRSFITEKLAHRLQIARTGSEVIHLASFGNSTQSVRRFDKATIHLKTLEGELITLSVLIVPTIAAPLNNSTQRQVSQLPYLRGLTLAHHVTLEDLFEIEVLVGADHFWNFIQDTVIRGDGPTAVASKLGFLLSGPLPATPMHKNNTYIMNVITAPPPICDLEKFWNLESIGVCEQIPKQTGCDILETYKQTCVTFENNQYVAKLPWKSDHEPLPSNYHIAKRRAESTIARLNKEPEMLMHYGKIIEEQEIKGFIERVPETELNKIDVHYIPHHAVRKDSTTTPIRVVYDCSCKQARDQPSLNDCLESTPPELNDLSGILLRFRLHEYGVSSDIEKAFLHVGLHEKDRDYTRFLWLTDPIDPTSALQTYRFRSVLFGATCSPFILNATIHKHLESNPCWVSDLLRQDLYVDNILTSLPQEKTAIEYFQKSRDIMSSGGFNLRSWTSNSATLRQTALATGVLDSDQITKVLGMRWNTTTDELMFTSKHIPDRDICTKREILQQTSRIYDPLGILSPVTIRAKLLLQEIWREKFDWDSPLPDNIQTSWTEIVKDLYVAIETKFQRHYFRSSPEAAMTSDSDDNHILHIFVDASQSAYGAVAYLCKRNICTLIMAKNRVAPLKQITLPRLELMAAVIGVRLAKHIHNTLPCQETHYWSDSQIVLHWIRAKKPLNRFVQNRIQEIREITGNDTWRYCPTSDNPADLQTRGLSASTFQESKSWQHGPRWILDKSKWPTWEPQTLTTLTTTTEVNTATTQSTTVPSQDPELIDFHRFSSYKRLLRVIAYVCRFLHNIRSTVELRKSGTLTVTELRQAEIHVVRCSQSTSFYAEIQELVDPKKSRHRISIVKQLHLYLDNDKLLRCKGRIHNAAIDECTKFPILLPNRHPITSLIVRDAHESVLHSGENATITHIRQKYWIPRIRQCVKSILKKCVICKKVIGRPYPLPETPPLVKYRLEESSPFTVTGVDFSGALHVKPDNGGTTKVYICLFTCATTRAIHLEVVQDLTEATFLQAFRRFCSRRSLPRLMVSDNGTTFHAAANQIRKLASSEFLHNHLGKKGTEWTFIPNRAPWFGGWWERLIGLTKTTLKKVLGRTCISINELQTVITEIEATINDRPLTYVSSNSDDPEPLTPAHLLHGRTITRLPYQYPDIKPIPMATSRSVLLKRADNLRKVIGDFQERWKREYLTALRERYQTTHGRTCNLQTIKAGDVVQIHEDKPRALWRLAIVEEVVHGRDGLVRSAKLRTKDGLTNRPITKLYPLETSIDQDLDRLNNQ